MKRTYHLYEDYVGGLEKEGYTVKLLMSCITGVENSNRLFLG